jgi:hypothetical protein
MEVLGDRTPNEVMFGRPPMRPIDFVLRRDTVSGEAELLDASPSVESIRQHADDLHSKLELLHDDVREASRIKGIQYRLSADNRNHAKPLVAEPGDYVLLLDTTPKTKLESSWSGPHQVVRIESDHSWVIRDLITDKEIVAVHPDRLSYYDDASLVITAEMRDQAAHNKYGYEVEKILDHELNDDGSYTLLVKWKGFDEISRRDLRELLEALTPLTLRYLRARASPPFTKAERAAAEDMIRYLGLSPKQILSASIRSFNDLKVLDKLLPDKRPSSKFKQ